jgi:hypothetical protein
MCSIIETCRSTFGRCGVQDVHVRVTHLGRYLPWEEVGTTQCGWYPLDSRDSIGQLAINLGS